MAWFRRRTLNEEIPELKPYYDEAKELGASRWPLIFSGVLLAVIIAVLVVFGGRWVYRKANDTNKKTPVAVTTSKSTKSTTKTSDNNSSKSTSSTSNTKTSTPSSSSSSTTKTNSSTSTSTPPASAPVTPPVTGTTLPNNGPGDVIALFVGSTLLAATLHAVYQRRSLRT